jgi:hypothetical protein
MFGKTPRKSLTNHWNNWIKKTVDIAFSFLSYDDNAAAHNKQDGEA